jgi:hypothetical protein
MGNRARLGARLALAQPIGDTGQVEDLTQTTSEGFGDDVGWEISVSPQQGRPGRISSTGDGRRVRAAVEHILHSELDQWSFLLDDHDLIEPVGEAGDLSGVERGHHA